MKLLDYQNMKIIIDIIFSIYFNKILFSFLMGFGVRNKLVKGIHIWNWPILTSSNWWNRVYHAFFLGLPGLFAAIGEVLPVCSIPSIGCSTVSANVIWLDLLLNLKHRWLDLLCEWRLLCQSFFLVLRCKKLRMFPEIFDWHELTIILFFDKTCFWQITQQLFNILDLVSLLFETNDLSLHRTKSLHFGFNVCLSLDFSLFLSFNFFFSSSSLRGHLHQIGTDTLVYYWIISRSN